MPEIKYDIIKNIGVLSESSKGWTKELNLISWNGREPKYDIRDRDPNHEKMGKGVALTIEVLKRLKEFLDGMALLNIILRVLTVLLAGKGICVLSRDRLISMKDKIGHKNLIFILEK